EIAKVAERLIVIDKGKILLQASLDDIEEKAYTLSGAAGKVLPLLENLNCIGRETAGAMIAAHVYDDRIVAPEGVEIGGLSLQDFFVSIVGGNKHE
ncbi:MAG: ABC transporter ATP-binding protein, partial [Treponema sp.]|nr:ABC transporter ATP-binding protein [Treponema sp.]